MKDHDAAVGAGPESGPDMTLDAYDISGADSFFRGIGRKFRLLPIASETQIRQMFCKIRGLHHNALFPVFGVQGVVDSPAQKAGAVRAGIIPGVHPFRGVIALFFVLVVKGGVLFLEEFRPGGGTQAL